MSDRTTPFYIKVEIEKKWIGDKGCGEYMEEEALRSLGFEYAKKYAKKVVRYRYHSLSGIYTSFDEKLNDLDELKLALIFDGEEWFYRL